ncbi:MFS transporter [Syntrophus gentianae]|uniref:MFS transporter n=1 Tax=Syntrophus gentianae TaxID=43775 RepID=UPI001587213B|nr:MFS transporter [Syntrophus gentianae]
MGELKNPGKILTPEFLVLNAVLFISYCNVAVFFEFHKHLAALPIAPGWHGILIAFFSLVVLALRPVISPFFTPANARFWLAVSSAGLVPVMFLYGPARDAWNMALVRGIHGAVYVVMVTALTSRIVACIPKDRSAQAFGLISVMTLFPYAVVPPLLEPLTRWAGGFSRVLELSSLLFLLVFPLLPVIKKPEGDTGASTGKFHSSDLWENLRDPSVILVLLLSLLIWTTFTPVFYFLKDYGRGIGISNPGWFFTLSTFTEIGVRLFAGSFFDRMDKRKLLAFSMVWLGLGYPAILCFRGDIPFSLLGLYMGLGWGVALPVLSGLVFDVSAPRFKALNTNLSMVMFQGGFFLGPLAGGAVLVHWGYPALYSVCAFLQIAGAAAALMVAIPSSVQRE